MKISEAFKMAFSSLVNNKMRAFLTMLGMVIGVGSVIAMISLMDGMISYVTDSFSDFGADTLTVSLMGKGSKTLTDDEIFAYVEENPDSFLYVSPQNSMSDRVKVGEYSIKSQSVTGVAETYSDIQDVEISHGRFLTYSDVEARLRVCVIGSYQQAELFAGENPVGEQIKIGDAWFTVVGVIEEQDDSSQNSADDCIYAPYTVVARMSSSANPTSYVFKMADSDDMDAIQDRLEDFLYEFYHDTDSYMVTNMATILDMMEDMVGIMEKILVGIAGISLLVAGIGIMNIMLVSVSERTREIGIRKSLGARQKDIMRQFVIEAAVLSSLGGLIGILLGGSATTAIGNALGISCAPSLNAIGISFGVSAGIGLLFGYMPAKRAARLNPIDALRSE